MKRSCAKPSFIYILAAITFFLLCISSYLVKASFLNVLPLFVSIFVMFLQTRVNRFAFLLGALNSILYAIIYFYMTLYSTALYALLVSFPFQLIAFINWHKNTRDGATDIRSLSLRGRLILFAGMAVFWLVLYLILSLFGSQYALLDNSLSVIGIVGTVLSILRFSEYAALGVVSQGISIVLYTLMAREDKTKVVWLIYSIYSIICCTISFIKMNSLKKEK